MKTFYISNMCVSKGENGGYLARTMVMETCKNDFFNATERQKVIQIKYFNFFVSGIKSSLFLVPYTKQTIQNIVKKSCYLIFVLYSHTASVKSCAKLSNRSLEGTLRTKRLSMTNETSSAVSQLYLPNDEIELVVRTAASR